MRARVCCIFSLVRTSKLNGVWCLSPFELIYFAAFAIHMVEMTNSQLRSTLSMYEYNEHTDLAPVCLQIAATENSGKTRQSSDRHAEQLNIQIFS